MSAERDYNNWLEGQLNEAKLQEFSVENVTVKNNVALAGLFPDITSSGIEKKAVVWELKYIKATILKKKIAQRSTLGECYGKIDISDDHKTTVLNEIRTELLKAKPQIARNASSYVTAEKRHQTYPNRMNRIRLSSSRPSAGCENDGKLGLNINDLIGTMHELIRNEVSKTVGISNSNGGNESRSRGATDSSVPQQSLNTFY